VAVTARWAYSNGFEFFVTRLVPPDRPGSNGDEYRPADGGEGPRSPSMTVGLEFADGSQVIGNVPSPAGDEEPPSRVLDFGGGTGSTHRGTRAGGHGQCRQRPDGLYLPAWSSRTRVSIDAQLILDAAQQSVQAWPSA